MENNPMNYEMPSRISPEIPIKRSLGWWAGRGVTRPAEPNPWPEAVTEETNVGGANLPGPSGQPKNPGFAVEGTGLP
jgi:hypothetical protein